MVATQELSYTATSNAMPLEWVPLNDVNGKVRSPYMTHTALPSDKVLSTQQLQHLLPMQKMLSACTGAIATSIFTTPFDVVKIRLQSQNLFQSLSIAKGQYSCQCVPADCQDLLFTTNNLRRKFLFTPAVSETIGCAHIPHLATSLRLNGTLDGLVKIVKYEGITSLWRGLVPALVMSVPATVIYFIGYDYLRDTMWQKCKNKSLEVYVPLAAGTIARTAAATVISPIELLRTRMQSAEGNNGIVGVLNGISRMVRSNGLSSLWRGLGPTLWRDVPFSAIYWTGYESTKKSLMKRHDNRWLIHNLSDIEISFICGAISGMIAATLTTPFDVAKTRRQVASGSGASKEMISIIREVFKEEGYMGLMKGWGLRVSKAVPACAIMISSYEAGKAFFIKRNATAND
ncbi:10936_t:CDS:2 [Paraglomus occultum]|uniref:10936_t:CDS:1 n=1 Tax=Paraglomus occultum TaxID=144539 RepID=A0A9N9AI26_9GLOM|nr:10936_t:CDS:2 [Paraglomus occultum]